jgi:hypothetical protein
VLSVSKTGLNQEEKRRKFDSNESIEDAKLNMTRFMRPTMHRVATDAA